MSSSDNDGSLLAYANANTSWGGGGTIGGKKEDMSSSSSSVSLQKKIAYVLVTFILIVAAVMTGIWAFDKYVSAKGGNGEVIRMVDVDDLSYNEVVQRLEEIEKFKKFQKMGKLGEIVKESGSMKFKAAIQGHQQAFVEKLKGRVDDNVLEAFVAEQKEIKSEIKKYKGYLKEYNKLFFVERNKEDRIILDADIEKLEKQIEEVKKQIGENSDAIMKLNGGGRKFAEGYKKIIEQEKRKIRAKLAEMEMMEGKKKYNDDMIRELKVRLWTSHDHFVDYLSSPRMASVVKSDLEEYKSIRAELKKEQNQAKKEVQRLKARKKDLEDENYSKYMKLQIELKQLKYFVGAEGDENEILEVLNIDEMDYDEVVRRIADYEKFKKKKKEGKLGELEKELGTKKYKEHVQALQKEFVEKIRGNMGEKSQKIVDAFVEEQEKIRAQIKEYKGYLKSNKSNNIKREIRTQKDIEELEKKVAALKKKMGTEECRGSVTNYKETFFKTIEEEGEKMEQKLTKMGENENQKKHNKQMVQELKRRLWASHDNFVAYVSVCSHHDALRNPYLAMRRKIRTNQLKAKREVKRLKMRKEEIEFDLYRKYVKLEFLVKQMEAFCNDSKSTEFMGLHLW